MPNKEHWISGYVSDILIQGTGVHRNSHQSAAGYSKNKQARIGGRDAHTHFHSQKGENHRKEKRERMDKIKTGSGAMPLPLYRLALICGERAASSSLKTTPPPSKILDPPQICNIGEYNTNTLYDRGKGAVV